VITNRTLAKAQALAADWQEQGKVLACSFNQLDQYYFDWIINGTAASLAGQQLPLPDGILAPQSWSYDMVYGPETSPFSHWAKQQGAQYNLDGLGMLVEQAAEAFFLWRAIRPDSQQVLKTLAQAIKPHS
jgi:shikimate dehydrogenase